MNSHQVTSHSAEVDSNLVEYWIRKDPTRWIAGALSGAFAGIMASAFAGVLAVGAGREFLYPVKLMGTFLVGPSGTEFGMHMGALIAGLAVIELLAVFWGVVFSHFVWTNILGALLPMGLVWGTFAWIFIWNLFLHSVAAIRWADISAGAVFPVMLVYGVSLTTVAFFDRALRGNRH